MLFDPQFQWSSDASLPVFGYDLIRYAWRPLILYLTRVRNSKHGGIRTSFMSMLPCTAEALLYLWKSSSVEHLGSMCLAQRHCFRGRRQSVFQSPPLCNMLRSAWLISSSNTPHICATTMTGVERFTSHGSLCILQLRGHGSVQSVS